MKTPFAAFCCVVLPVLTGCSPSPAQPAPPLAVVAPVPPLAPASMLNVSAFTVTLSRQRPGGQFHYEAASLEVAETSGTNSATLTELTITGGGGVYVDDPGCPFFERIGPGERVELVKRIGSCLPYAVTSSEVTGITVTGKFVDERNVAGYLQKSISVQGCTLSGATGSTICK